MTEPSEPTGRHEHDDDRDDRAERAFREGLRRHADEPDFQPLHPPTPARGRGGLPRWLPVAAAVVLVAAVAIPLAINQLRGGSSSSAVPAGAPAPERGPADSPSAPEPSAARTGWRWESYRVLSYQVPQIWDYGWAPASDWCAGRIERPSGPFVDLAPDVRPVALILCPRELPAKELQTFVTVRPVTATDHGWDLPAGWTATVSTEVAGYVVEVVHNEGLATVADQIVASVRPIGEVDPNGCPVRSALEPAAANPSVAGRALVPVTLCQYDLAVSPAQLLASKALADRDDRVDYNARQVMAALAKAPKGAGPDDTSCDAVGGTAALVRLWDGSVPSLGSDVVVRYAGCRGNGVFTATGSRKLTAEVCHAVLQPPLIFTTGFGLAPKLCVPPVLEDGTATPTPGASDTPSPRPSRSRK